MNTTRVARNLRARIREKVETTFGCVYNPLVQTGWNRRFSLGSRGC